MEIFKFIEINPRFGGGFPLTYLAGGKFPQWIIQDVMNIKNKSETYQVKDNVIMLRFDSEIILDRHEETI